MSNLLHPNQANIEYDAFSDPDFRPTLSAGGGLSLDTTQHVYGSGSLKVATGGGWAYESLSINLPASAYTPGAAYTFSAYLRSDTTPTLRFYCQVNDQEVGNIHIGTVGSVTLDGTWTRYSFTVTMPSDFTGMHLIGLRVDTGGTAQAINYWMDGLQIEEGATLSPWQAPTPDLVARGNTNAVLDASVTNRSYFGALTVLMGGKNISDFVDEMSISVESVLGQGAGSGGSGIGRGTTCSFLCYLGPVSKALGAGQAIPSGGPYLVRQGEVVIYDATGTRIFGGYATRLDDASARAASGTAAGSINVATVVNCHDYWVDLDRVEVNEVYTGYDDVQIISALLTKYAPWIDQSQLPPGGSYVFEKRFIRATGLRTAIQKVADVVGWQVWIDAYGAMHYISPTAASGAPFGLSDQPNGLDTVGYVLTKYSTDDNAVINRAYFYGGKNVSDDFDQDLSVQANGVNTTFSLAYYPHNASDGQIHVIKNGSELVMYSIFDTDPTHKLKSDPNGVGTADVLLNADAEVLTFDSPPLGTDTLICRYRYNTPLVVVLSSQASFQFYGDWYDGKISDNQVFDTTTALQRCRILLARQAFGLTTLSLSTWVAGLQAGQLVHVVNALRGLDDTYQVQKVTAVPVGAGYFEWDIDLGAWNYNLLDLLLSSAQMLQPTDTTTEEDTEVVQAQERAHTAVAVVVWGTRNGTSGVYYSRSTALDDTHDAYSGFFTITS